VTYRQLDAARAPPPTSMAIPICALTTHSAPGTGT